MVICVLLPRFELVIAAGGREALARGPAALAPEPGREQMIGEVSQSAEAFGVHAGMRLGEALARCSTLALIPPDPVGVADAWEKVLARLESMGAAVESEGPGSAVFDARGLRRPHRGRPRVGAPHAVVDGVLAAGGLRRLHGGGPRLGAPHAWLDGVVAVARAALRLPVRIGAGPSRFCAFAAASRAGARRTEIIDGDAALAGEPVALLRRRPEVAALVGPLERLGLSTLGALAAL